MGWQDTGRRLPGERESETSPLLDDAQHWLRVYAELLAFKRTLLPTVEVHEELERLSRRHSFWRERVKQLQRS